MSAVRAVVLDGALTDPGAAALGIDDPGVRWGEGLFETMRAEAGRVPLLARHLARMRASARALGLGEGPGAGAERDVAVAVAACGAPRQRVRLTWTGRPTLLVEAVPHTPADPWGAAAVALPGTWWPEGEIAAHKTLSYAGPRLAARRARHRGASEALLLDARGRLGEASTGSVFCEVPGGLATPPLEGILPGVARAVVIEEAAPRAGIPVEVRHLEEPEWRSAREIVLTNALRGVVPVLALDGAPVGGGPPGPLARRLAAAWTEVTGLPVG
jgi:branched-chain amino acid aminotransferase